MKEMVRVRISSDAAGSIALTPVVVREMALAELADHMVAVFGKDKVRIREVVLRGSLVSGASRLRWEGWSMEDEEVAALLAPFPDPDPRRPLELSRCTAIVLCAGAQKVTVPRVAAEKRRLLKLRSFWHTVAELSRAAQYSGYSYRDKGDIYRVAVSRAEQVALQEASRLISYATLARQLSVLGVDAIEFCVPR